MTALCKLTAAVSGETGNLCGNFRDWRGDEMCCGGGMFGIFLAVGEGVLFCEIEESNVHEF